MKLGLILIAIGLGDIILTMGLGAVGGVSSIRFVIDMLLIVCGVLRIRAQRKRAGMGGSSSEDIEKGGYK